MIWAQRDSYWPFFMLYPCPVYQNRISVLFSFTKLYSPLKCRATETPVQKPDIIQYLLQNSSSSISFLYCNISNILIPAFVIISINLPS